MINSKGISLIEVLVSLFIISLIIGSFTGIFTNSTRVRDIISKQLKTIYAVRNEMEILMSKDTEYVYNSAGVKKVDNLYIRTSVSPYSINTDEECFYITIKPLEELGETITVIAPDDYRDFPLNEVEGSHNLYMDIGSRSYTIQVGDQSIVGQLKARDKPQVQINLMDRQCTNYLDFNVTGDADITVYPGNCTNWNIICDDEYTVFDRYFYRDYSILKVKIEAFKDEGLNSPVYKIENIIRSLN